MALPTVSSVSGSGVLASTQLLNATDVAGTIACTFSTTGVATLTFNFGYAYDTPPIVIFSAANNVGAQNRNSVYATSSTTQFTLNFTAGTTTNSIYNYHIFETQTNNASSPWTWVGTGGGVTSSKCTDIAGCVTTAPSSITSSIAGTCSFGYAYATAPIVVFSPADSASAGNVNNWWSNSSTSMFNLSANENKPDANIFNYHIIETQSVNGSAPFNGVTLTNTSTASISNGTDTAGNISISFAFTGGAQNTAFTFGYTYATPPIVVISPTKAAAAAAMKVTFVNSTTTGFSINMKPPGVPTTATCTYAYHVIETQA